MSKVISDARLLSLTGLFLDRDGQCLPAGAHLRWWMTPSMGLPRMGFRLRRRPSLDWERSKGETADVFLNKQSVATSVAGIHCIAHPLRIEHARLTPNFFIAGDAGKVIRLVYEPREQDDLPWSPFTHMAFGVRGGVLAMNGLVDIRAFVVRDGQTIQVARKRARFGSLPSFDGSGGSLRTLFVTASEIHFVDVTLPSGVLIEIIRYALPEFTHRSSRWEDVAILPPLCAPGTPHAMAPQNVRLLAAQRLAANRPIRRPGDRSDAGQGRLWTPGQHAAFESSMADAGVELAETISRAFALEMLGRSPGEITIADAEGGRSPSPDGTDGSIDLPFYAVLQAGLFAPHIAAMLGLAHHDAAIGQADGRWDYAVDALVPQMWARLAAMAPTLRKPPLRLSSTMIAPSPKADVWEDEPTDFMRLAAFLFDHKPSAETALAPPQADVAVVQDATATRVQARIAIMAQPGAEGQRTLAWRQTGSHTIVGRGTIRAVMGLNEVDAASRLMRAAIAGPNGLVRFIDRKLTGYGTHRYVLADVDCFGRASAIVAVAVEVVDRVAPPPPPMPDVALGKPDPSVGNRFSEARLSVFWDNNLAAAAPDLAVIRFLWRSGSHSAAETLASPDGQADVAVGSSAARTELNGTRFEMTSTLLAARDGLRREVTVICVAEDQSGNRSEPSLENRLVLVDEIKRPAPPQPAEPQWTSWPDARGDARWTLEWQLPAGANAARVSMVTEKRLLAHARAPLAEHFLRDHGQRAERLRRLAVTHPSAFAPVAVAYPAHVARHELVLPAGSEELHVAVVEFIGETGQKADWPSREDAFAVVRVRPSRQPAVPRLTCRRDGDDDVIEVSASDDGTIELFALTHPDQIGLLDIARSIAQLPVGGDAHHRHSRLATDRWVGYTARLRAEDGTISASSPVRWREFRH